MVSFFEAENLRAVCGGRWLEPPRPPVAVSGVGIDTRGDLRGKAFIAIRGERHDGHAYLSKAVGAGASLVVVEREPPAGRLSGGVGVLLVDDTRRALGRMARAYRRTLTKTTVIAVTGSAGKTTTKGLIHAVLSVGLPGSAAPRSYNNEIGVPLTILGADPGDRYVVVEVGSSTLGETDRLGRMVEPDIAVITSIGRAHLAGLGSIEGVAREKAALLAHRRPSGTSVVTADAPSLRRHLPADETVVRFGKAADADLRLTDRGRDESGWWFEVDGERRFPLGLPGEYNALNALAAVAVARHLGVADRRIDEPLARSTALEMRMTTERIGETVVYNDAYNANPDAVIASLGAFAELAADAPRRVIVLGDMLELGEAAAELHREIGRCVVDLDRRVPIDQVVLIGPLAAWAAEPIRRAWSAQRVTVLEKLTPSAAATVADLLQPGDAVLLKGSRAVAVERVITAMRIRQEKAMSHA